MDSSLIYGKDTTERVVSVEVQDGSAELFIEHPDGTITSEFRPHNYWLLYPDNKNPKFKRLEGSQYFKYMVEYPTYERWREVIQASYKKRYHFYTAHDPKANYMLRSGVTMYKGLKIEDVSVLSFDIETTGLNPKAPDAQVLLISNTLRRAGKVTKKLFCVDDYESDAEMIQDWCGWIVNDINPSILIGHYILGFDLPYLKARLGQLFLGRNGSAMEIQDRVRQFRKDGSQTYDFNDILIYGREVIDTKFLAMKYDTARKFPNYSLKPMIAHLGLEKKGRTFVDASKMKELWADQSMRQKIKDYAMDDSDDALKLYDLMIPGFFYFTQHLPFSLQEVNNSATGKQVNGLLVRGYLQENHSIPRPDEIEKYPGGLVFGEPGVHKNALRFDISSLYPSIMLQYDLGPGPEKDPKGYFGQLLQFFTNERLANKALAKQTGDKTVKDRADGQKIFINSGYGALGAPGINFNNGVSADAVTRLGREILAASAYHMSGREFDANANVDVSEDAESA